MASLIDDNNCLPGDRMLWKVSLSGDVRSKVFFVEMQILWGYLHFLNGKTTNN